MNILQLNPPIPVYVKDRGTAQAMFLIDYSPEHQLFWVCFMDETSEIWTVDNIHVRAQKNISLGRTLDTKIN
jgi:hypothetical protein